MQLHPSGYYAWLKEPVSYRDKTNGILMEHIKEAYEQSHKVYGYRNITKDLRESGIKNVLQDLWHFISFMVQGL